MHTQLHEKPAFAFCRSGALAMPTPVGGVNPDQYIYVPSKFQVKPGAKIRNDLFVGPGLGVGLQVTQPLLAACQFAREADAGNSY